MDSSSSLGPFSPSSPSLTQVIKDGEYGDWAELPYELTSSILSRLDNTDILENAQKVCTSWRRACKDPSMWRKIVMRRRLENFDYDLEIMCRHEVDRSQGGLLEIDIWHVATDSLLNYIANSSSNLRSLKLAMCSPVTSEGLTEALVRLPLLEELEVSCCSLSPESLKVVGPSLPNLKTLKLNRMALKLYPYVSDDDALAIAETMPRLGYLQLLGNKLTDAGLNAILDNCPKLEHLDLRQCINVNLFGDLKKRCFERVKVFRPPYDSTHDYLYDEIFFHMDSSEDDDYGLMTDDDYNNGYLYYDYYPSDYDNVSP